MRKEATIRARLDQYRKSRYRRFYAEQIGILLWILGESSSPRVGEIMERESAIEEPQ